MCGIAGMLNLKSNLKDKTSILENMTSTLKKRGPDAFGYYVNKHALLGHRRLIVVDPSGGIQPMKKNINGKEYIIVYNGELYNTEEVRKSLIALGYAFNSYSDTEVLLLAYIAWGSDCTNYINGIFAFGIWNESDKTLFLCRDPLGVKPLYYSLKNHTLIFGSEIKTILASSLIEPILDEKGLCEIFGLGPAKSLDSGVFKNIYQLPPANFLIFNRDGIKLTEYWKLTSIPHTEDIDETAEHIKILLIDAIKGQLVSDVPVCTFLSGGLDSSIISTVAALHFKELGQQLNTYSIEYKDNSKYFKASEFQPNSDEIWVDKMTSYIKSNHKKVILDSPELIDALEDAALASDFPGMADIDSSLFLFCKKVRKNSTVALSGECADEIFGGYPWFRNPEYINADTFPWSTAVKERSTLLSPALKNIDLEGYVQNQYETTLKQVPHLDGESKAEHRMRELFYLNVKWFMITLLTRKDRMSMANSLEVRVPFADRRLVEYAFNIPNDLKFYNGREKGLLRKALTGYLPEDVLWRKKSPYPKTFNPEYTNKVQIQMTDILKNTASPILQIVDNKVITDITSTAGASFGKPWFGQLMKGPQLLAYLIQVNFWLEKYKVKIEI